MTKTLDATTYDTDKSRLESYEAFLRPLLDRDVRLFELGIFHGGVTANTDT